MTPGRAALYIGGAMVLAAWLAAAAMPDVAREEQPAAPPVATAGTEHLASDVRAQSVRLRHRLAAAPAPAEPRRNPFAFVQRELPRSRVAPAHPIAPATIIATPSAPAEPVLALAGIAEQRAGKGVMRTAVIVGAGDELFMVREGQPLLGRYTVAAIGPDVVELKDSLTGLPRRLALR